MMEAAAPIAVKASQTLALRTRAAIHAALRHLETATAAAVITHRKRANNRCR